MTVPQYQFNLRDTMTAIIDEYARRHKPAAGQLGLFEKPEERQKPLFSKRVDDESGKWITMRGARVFISGEDGRIMKGPKRLMGKTKEQIERESAGKEGAGDEKTPKPKPLAEMGRISGGRADNRQKKLFEELNPGFQFEDDEDEDFKTVEPNIKLRGMEGALEPVEKVEREITSRRLKLAENAIERLKQKNPLFADQIEEEEGSPEERLSKMDSEHSERWVERDRIEKEKFINAMNRFKDLPDHVREDAIAQWNSSGTVTSGYELSNFIENALAGRSQVLKGIAHPEIEDEETRSQAEKIERSRALIADMVLAGKSMPIQRDAEMKQQLRQLGVNPNEVGKHPELGDGGEKIRQKMADLRNQAIVARAASDAEDRRQGLLPLASSDQGMPGHKLTAMDNAQHSAIEINGTLEGPESEHDYKTAYLKEREKQKAEMAETPSSPAEMSVAFTEDDDEQEVAENLPADFVADHFNSDYGAAVEAMRDNREREVARMNQMGVEADVDEIDADWMAGVMAAAEDQESDQESDQETETRNISLSSLMEDASDEMEDTKPANVAWWKNEIESKGIENVEPARVGLTADGKMTVINGRHRMKAAMELGLDEFPAVVDVGGESFELDSSPQPSPSTSKPEDFGKSDSTKQGALFDTGKGDLPGQELLFNSDAGDLNNPKTMENRAKQSPDDVPALTDDERSRLPEHLKTVTPLFASEANRLKEMANKDPSSPAENTDPISALTDDIMFLRSGYQSEILQQSLGIKTPKMGKQGTINVQKALRKIPGGNVIATMLATGSEHGHLVEFDRNGFPMIGNDAFQKAVDGKFNREDLNAAKEFLETTYSNSGEFGNVNQYRWLSGVARVAKPKSENNPSPAKKKSPEKPSASSIQSHLDNDDHESAFEAFSKLRKDEIDKVAREVLGMGFYNKSKAQMLEALKRTLPLATKTASEAAQKQEDIDYAAMKLRKAKENQKAHSEDRLGAPIRPGVPEIAYTDPHGEGRAEVAKAWQAEVDDAQRELDKVKGVKAAEKAEDKPKAKKQPGEKFQHRVKEDFEFAVSRIDKNPNWVEFTVHNQHPNPDFQKELIRHISGKHPELFESIKSRGKSNMGIKFAIKSLEEEESKTASPEKYSREHILQTMNTVIDRYVRPESEGAVQVDHYAHPLVHAAVGAGAHLAINSVFKGQMRSVMNMALGAAMAAWVASSAPQVQAGQANQPATIQQTVPMTPGQKQAAGNNAVNQIVAQAMAQHNQNAQAAANAPPSPNQQAAHSISAAAAGKAGVPGAGGPRPLTGGGAPVSVVPTATPANKPQAQQTQTAGKGGARPLRDPGDSGGGNSSNSDQPRQPAGASESKGGQFAPKGGPESGSSSGESAPEAPSSPADGDSGASESSSTETPSPRNYPDNLNKPASEQTDYSPPERSIEPPKIDKPIHTGERQSRKAAWEQHLQGMTQQVAEKKESAKAEKKQAKEMAKATSFNPAELEAESSQMIDDIGEAPEAPKEDDFDSAKDYEKAVEKHNRSIGAKQATIKKRANANLIPEIAGEHDLDHSTLEQAVNDEIAMLLPYHNRKEEARQYISKMGWNARRINQAEDRGIDSSSAKFDDVASQWADMFPEIAGSDESEWVAKMWDLSREGVQDPPSASDEDLVRRVAKRLAESGASSSPADSDSESDFEPYTYNPEDPESTPFSRTAVIGLIVDKYMRQLGLC
jgi:hypothetical protein